MSSDVLDPVAVLEALAGCPTAPFHEGAVAARIVGFCREPGLEWRADPYGNLIVRHRGGTSQPIAFCAHMDHPALEVIEGAPLAGRLLGGLPRQCFDRPVPVRFILENAEVPGRITGHFQGEDLTGLYLEAAAAVPAGTFAVFDVGGWREENGLLYQPAADDLAGCAAILAALARCAREGVPADVYGVFTRCEEVGMVGATLVARQALLPPETLVVSLEASRALPGAELGGGPVIRVGDAARSFHPEGEAALRRARARLQARDPHTRVQRQLMSGGVCEASAYAGAGYKTAGIAFPLGNYHNVGPEFTVAAEYIHRQDLCTGADLIVAAAECMAEPPEPDPLAERWAQRADAHARRLADTAAAWGLAHRIRR